MREQRDIVLPVSTLGKASDSAVGWRGAAHSTEGGTQRQHAFAWNLPDSYHEWQHDHLWLERITSLTYTEGHGHPLPCPAQSGWPAIAAQVSWEAGVGSTGRYCVTRLGREPTVPQRAADALQADLPSLGPFVKTLIFEREIPPYLDRLQTTLHLRACATFYQNQTMPSHALPTANGGRSWGSLAECPFRKARVLCAPPQLSVDRG